MESSLSIRSPLPDDYTQWKVLWGGYNAFYGREGSTALPDNIINTAWQRIFDEAEPVHCLVAELDGQLVGLAHYIFHRNMIAIEPMCYLQDLFTSEPVRGKGVGCAMMAEFYKQAKNGGATRVYWHTHSTNETARRLYDRIAIDTEFTVYRKDA